MSIGKNLDSGASEGARRATGEGPESNALSGRGRWSAKRKVSVVIELLRGEDLETLSRLHGITAATISAWRDAFLTGGEAGLKSREVDIEDEEKLQLKSVVAELAVSNELLKEKIRLMEKNRPLAFGKSKP
jgi:transposase